MDAPTFSRARQVVADLFDNLVFATVMQPCTIPDSAYAEDGSVTHYFGTADERSPLQKGTRRRVWFQRGSRMHDGFWVGPASVMEPADMPQTGDMLVGIAVNNEKPSKSGRMFGGLRYESWQAGAKPAWELARLVNAGTSASESSLRPILKTKTAGGEDEIWAIARLILFGNIAAFNPDGKDMVLRKSPVSFVHECSVRFSDPSIWMRYLQLFPTARPPSKPAAVMGGVQPIRNTLQPLQPLQPDHRRFFVPTVPSPYEQLHHHGDQPPNLYPEFTTYAPISADGTHVPPHMPHSPPPESPPYVPHSPPYLPDLQEIPELPVLSDVPPPPPPHAAPLNIDSLRALLVALQPAPVAPAAAAPAESGGYDYGDEDVDVIMS